MIAGSGDGVPAVASSGVHTFFHDAITTINLGLLNL